MYKLILALAVVTTIGAIQLPLAFAQAPDQGGDPHNQLALGDCVSGGGGGGGGGGTHCKVLGTTPSTGDPHSPFAPQGNPHLCTVAPPGKVGPTTQC